MEWVMDPLWPWSTAISYLGSLPLLALVLPIATVLMVSIFVPVLYQHQSSKIGKLVVSGIGMGLPLLAFFWLLLQGALGSSGISGGFRASAGLLFVALPALVIGLTIWSYVGIPNASVGRIGWILLLRLSAMLFVLLIALRPSISISDKKTVRSNLYMVLDSSESMTIQDESDQSSRWDHLQRTLEESKPLLKQLEKQDTEIKWLHFASESADFNPLVPASPSGKVTDTGNALRGILEKLSSDEKIRGMLLFSDGADNGTGRFPPMVFAQRLRDLSCNLHTFGMGRPTTTAGQTDLALVSISTEPTPTIPIGGEISVKVVLNSPGFQNAFVGIRLLLDGVPVDAKIFQDDKAAQVPNMPSNVIQLKHSEGNEIILRHRPMDKLGEIKVTVEVGDHRREFAPMVGEISSANNRLDTFVTVVKEGTRVLLVDKQRAWEPQFICDALGKDPRISLFPVWLRGLEKPDDDVRDLFRFDQRNYDAIIFGDVSAAQLGNLGPNILEQIERMVFEKGTGFMMLGGYQSFGNGDWKGTPIEKLLPVLLDAQGQIDNPLKMVPTDDGLRRYSYILKVTNQAQETNQAWAKLKELDGQTKLGSLRPGLSSVLAESDRKNPLLVTQNYGKGRTLAFAADTTYKWIRNPESKQVHARFWAQMVRWLARQEEMEGSVVVIPDSRRVAVRGELGFRTLVRGKDGNELDQAKFGGVVIGPDGKSTRVSILKRGNEYRGSFADTEKAGEYRIEVEGEALDPSGAMVQGKSSARFVVYEEDLEMTRRQADHEFLRKLAQSGGGTFQEGDKIKEFLQKMIQEPPITEKTGVRYYPDWKSSQPSPVFPIVLTLFVMILGLEWLCRRLWGLV